MFELPEYLTLARQIDSTLTGKTIRSGSLGNSPHKFVWYNRSPDEFDQLTTGKVIGGSRARGKWLFVDLEPGYVLLFGECGGRILYHMLGEKLPDKYHLKIDFEDGSSLTATTQMWGAMELYEQGKEKERKYLKDMRLTPVDVEFTFGYFDQLIDSLLTEKRSVKSLLTQDQLIPGVGNAIAQDIMFEARLHPKHLIQNLGGKEKQALFDGIQAVLNNAIEKGGRMDEVDLFNQPGGYERLMDSKKVGGPCPNCATKVEKIQYLGGACYFCPKCQV